MVQIFSVQLGVAWGERLAEQISVLIVDDHFIVRKGLLALLSECDDIFVMGEAADGNEAVDRAAELAPDVVLMDIMMPVLDGVAATRAILARRPETRIVAMTSAAGNQKVLEAVRAGALGYIAKSAAQDELVAALRRVHRGEPCLPAALTRQLLAQWSRPPASEGITKREGEILRLVAKGLPNQEIALRLHIAEPTVRTHLTHLFGKLGAANRVEATLCALRDGWTTLEESLGS
jgi:NarL family two-component system response regulator LiaR